MTVEELRRMIKTQEEDPALEARLQALEASIKRHTGNSFARVMEESGGEWPADIKLGVARLIAWEMGAGQKIGIASETISRHAVTYESQTADNSVMGYPAALMGFLKPYMRARFGQRGELV